MKTWHSSMQGYYKADGSTVARWSFTGGGTVQLCRTSRLSKMERGFSNAEVRGCQIKTFGAQIMIGIMQFHLLPSILSLFDWWTEKYQLDWFWLSENTVLHSSKNHCSCDRLKNKYCFKLVDSYEVSWFYEQIMHIHLCFKSRWLNDLSWFLSWGCITNFGVIWMFIQCLN